MTLMPRTSLFALTMTLAGLVAPAQAQQEAAQSGAASESAEMTETESTVHVVMKTSKGDIYIALDGENAPISTENFLRYTDEDTYDGTVFHRVIATFMIQGGGFEPSGEKRATHEPIKNEWRNGLKNVRGSIAMARTNNPDSATNQFFINVTDNAMLDVARPATGGAAYAVFGMVVKGMEVVDEIRAVQTTRKRGMADWPVEDVKIEEVRRLTDDEVATLTAELEAAEAGEGDTEG